MVFVRVHKTAKRGLVLTHTNDASLTLTSDHRIQLHGSRQEIKVGGLREGDIVETSHGPEVVQEVRLLPSQLVQFAEIVFLIDVPVQCFNMPADMLCVMGQRPR